jgi:putative membrane protein
VKNTWLKALGDLGRGALIGLAEIIPGVSGGTIALIVGVYERIILSAASFVRLRFREVEWRLLLPLLLGMFAAIFAGAAAIEPLLANYPSLVLAFFAGLIAASLRLPFLMAREKWGAKNFAIAAAAALLAAALTLLPEAASVSLAPWQIALSAAVAVCALVVPGVSGSFLLLALGVYGPTLAAVNSLDFGFLGWFVLGAVLGLGAFVNLLRWLITKHREYTFTVVTGLMAGSLLALWPWGYEAGAPVSPVGLPLFEILWFTAGLSLVVVLTALETRSRKR